MDFAAKSFADVGGGNRSAAIELKKPSMHRGEPAMVFTKEDIEILPASFKFALIGKFSHGRPSIPEIHKVFDSIGLRAAFTFGLLDHKHILMRFNHEDNYQRIWLREQWYLKRCPMRMFKWTPEFNVNFG